MGYYSILKRVIGSLEPNTADARRAVYNRARQVLVDKLQADGAHDLPSKIAEESSAFEAAIQRIESEMAPSAPRRWTRLHHPVVPLTQKGGFSGDKAHH